MTESLAARWEQYNDAGRRAFSQGHLEEAEDAFRAAVREGEKLGAESPQVAASLNAVGQIRFQVRDFAAAEPLLTRGLAIREKLNGGQGHTLVPTLNTLAALYDATGDSDRAEALLRRSLAISEHHLGLSNPEVSATLSNLAKLCFKQRDFAKADRLLLRLLEIKRALGKDHPEVATVLGSLAKLRQIVGKHEQGEQLWRQALAIRERCFAPNDLLLATTLENVADCCAPVPGRVAEAITLRERAMGIREHATSPNHQAIAAARVKLNELRLRARADTALPPQPPPRRSSQELPSPVTSQEFSSALQDEARRLRHSDELPWIQLDGPGQLPAQFDTIAPPPLSRSRTPAASVTPMGMPKQGVTAPVHSFAPPVAPPTELVLMDSILPEPPTMRGSMSGRAVHHVPPAEPRKASSGRSARYVAPDLDSTVVDTRRRAPRVPSSMARRGSSKRLVLAGAVVILLAVAAWAARGRLGAAPAPAEGRAQRAAKAASKQLPTVSVFSQLAQTAQSLVRMDSDPAPIAIAKADTVRRRPSAKITKAAAAAAARGPSAGGDNGDSPRDTTVRVNRSPDEAALQLKVVPTVGNPSDVDVVTSNVEQSTKSKVESAQRPTVFKKP